MPYAPAVCPMKERICAFQECQLTNQFNLAEGSTPFRMNHNTFRNEKQKALPKQRKAPEAPTQVAMLEQREISIKSKRSLHFESVRNSQSGNHMKGTW